MRLDWADLRIFLHVCEAGSMTQAATRCHLTLAAISARMRNLEDSTGVLLLQRQPRGVTPTAAGEVLAAHARRIFDQVQLLERELLPGREAAAPPVVVLANSSALAQWLPESHGLVCQDLGADPLVLVVPVTHPLAAQPCVRFDRAIAEPWVAWGGAECPVHAPADARVRLWRAYRGKGDLPDVAGRAAPGRIRRRCDCSARGRVAWASRRGAGRLHSPGGRLGAPPLDGLPAGGPAGPPE